jgi:hypothetical protein
MPALLGRAMSTASRGTLLVLQKIRPNPIPYLKTLIDAGSVLRPDLYQRRRPGGEPVE